MHYHIKHLVVIVNGLGPKFDKFNEFFDTRSAIPFYSFPTLYRIISSLLHMNFQRS